MLKKSTAIDSNFYGQMFSGNLAEVMSYMKFSMVLANVNYDDRARAMMDRLYEKPPFSTLGRAKVT